MESTGTVKKLDQLAEEEQGCYSCGKIAELHDVCGRKICKECAAIVADTLSLWKK